MSKVRFAQPFQYFAGFHPGHLSGGNVVRRAACDPDAGNGLQTAGDFVFIPG
jgi:hypothetical protein